MLEIVSSSGGHTFQMWATFGFILLALGLYMVEGISIEVTSIGIICLLICFFIFFRCVAHLCQRTATQGHFIGFANSALITVLALLVVGQGMVRAMLERRPVGGRPRPRRRAFDPCRRADHGDRRFRF